MGVLLADCKKSTLHLRRYRNNQAIPQSGSEWPHTLTSFSKAQQRHIKLKHRDVKDPFVSPKAFYNCPPLPARQLYPQQFLLLKKLAWGEVK